MFWHCGERGSWFLVGGNGEASGIQTHISQSIVGQAVMGWLRIVSEFVAQESGSHAFLENTVVSPDLMSSVGSCNHSKITDIKKPILPQPN